MQSEAPFLNNLPVCCSESPGIATLDSISGPRQANLGQSCGRFLNAQAEWLPDCVHACERVCLCMPVWISVLVWIYDYVCPFPKASALLPARPEPIHVSFIGAVLQQIVWRNSELIVWFYASSFKKGSHMAPYTVKWAIL